MEDSGIVSWCMDFALLFLGLWLMLTTSAFIAGLFTFGLGGLSLAHKTLGTWR